MAKTTIWRVHVTAKNYATSRTFLVRAKNAGAAESAALRLAKKWDEDLVAGEKKHQPYADSVELIGDLDT